jgi:Transglycosylase SLT domain
MLEGTHVTRISVRGFAVASATAVTAVGAVVGVASGSEQADSQPTAEATDATLLADIPSAQTAQQVAVNFGQQAQSQSDAADSSAKKAAEDAARKKAADDAATKKAAADALAKKRAKEKEEASRGDSRTPIVSLSASGGSYSVAQVQAMARQIVGDGQFQCFSSIVSRESGWNYHATNPSTGAYGLVQALPGSKMASAGADWQTNPATQIKWGLNYMNSRYGSPCGAWSFWQANHWY